MVIVEDPSPTYEYRVAGGSGFKMVNAKSFDLKQKLRRQKGTSLHATTNHREFRRDLMYLTGQRAADYQPLSGAWDGTVEDLHQDIVGADGWRNLTEVFAVLNEAVDYVVLRNFEKLPNEHILGPHEDIDFLVEDVDAYHRAAAILNKEQAAHTKIGNRKIYFDFRAVEDFYYDPKWCRRLLRDKVLIRGFYAPSQNDYFFSLLYHGHVAHRAARGNRTAVPDVVSTTERWGRKNRGTPTRRGLPRAGAGGFPDGHAPTVDGPRGAARVLRVASVGRGRGSWRGRRHASTRESADAARPGRGAAGRRA